MLLTEYTVQQQYAILVASKAAATLSIIGSTLLISKIWSTKRVRSSTKGRFLLGMSMFDIVGSCAIVVGTWAFPVETQVLGASGNRASCTAEGFFATLGYGVLLYNIALSIYFLVTVKYRQIERWMVRHEKYIHSFILVYISVASILAVVLRVILPRGYLCMISFTDEAQTVCDPEEEGCRVYGGVSFFLFFSTTFLLVVTGIIVGTYVILVLYFHVRGVERKLQRYAAQPDFQATEQVAIQGLMYTSGLLFTYIPGLVYNSLLWAQGSPNFVAHMLTAATFPLQGAVNALVFWRTINQTTSSRIRRGNSRSSLGSLAGGNSRLSLGSSGETSSAYIGQILSKLKRSKSDGMLYRYGCRHDCTSRTVSRQKSFSPSSSPIRRSRHISPSQHSNITKINMGVRCSMVDPEHDSLESDIEDSDDRLEPETSKHQKKSTTSKKHTIEDDNHVGLDFDSDAKSDILYDDNVFGLSCDTDFKSDVVNDDGGVVEPLDQARTQLRGGLKDC